MITNIIEKTTAEEATGIEETGVQMWSEDIKIKEKKAKKLLYQNKEVAVPGAGAGSYREIFEALGFEKVEVVEWTSNAGDWSFGVKDKTGWRMAWQTNRYPHHGFTYDIDIDNFSFDSFEDLLKFTENY